MIKFYQITFRGATLTTIKPFEKPKVFYQITFRGAKPLSVVVVV